MKAIIRPVVEAWLLKHPDHLRGLGDEIDAALEQHGLSVSVLKARMAEETGERATEDNARIVLWLGLLPPTTKTLQERVLELAQQLGRGPSSQELEDHGLYVYRKWASLDEMYVELALAPPTNLSRSLTHYVSYVSQFERRIAEVLATELEAGRINWVTRQWRFDPVRRYTADFVVFASERVVVVEADGYGMTDARKARFHRASDRSRTLAAAATRVGAAILVACPHPHTPIVGRLVAPAQLAAAIQRCAADSSPPRPASVAELSALIRDRIRLLAERPPPPPPSAQPGNVLSRAAAALGSLLFWSADDVVECVLAGRTPTVALDAGQLDHRREWFEHWERERPRALAEVAELLSVSERALRRTLPRLVGTGAVIPVPGPRSDLYGVDDVRRALIRDGSLERIELLPRGYLTLHAIAKELGIGRELAIRLATDKGVARRSASGICVPASSRRAMREALAQYRASTAVNRQDDAFVPPDAVALGDAGQSVLPGVLLSGKAVDALIAAAKIKVHSQATPIGKLKVILEKDLSKLRAEARRQAEAVRGSFPGIAIRTPNPDRHLSLPDLAEEVSSASYGVSAKQVLGYVIAGKLRPAGVHRGNPNWQLHFDRKKALRALRRVGLPVPDGYVPEEVAAARIGVDPGTLRARVKSNHLVRQALGVHCVASWEGRKELRFYASEALDAGGVAGYFDRSRRPRPAPA